MSSGFREFRKRIKYALWRSAGCLAGTKQRDSKIDRIRSVLVVRPDRLGDVVLSTPVFESIRRSLPEVEISALVDPIGASVLADNPAVDRIIEWRRNRPWKTLGELMRHRFDLAFNLNKTFSATATLLTLASGARRRVGYDHPENAWVHHLRVPPQDESRHETQNNLQLLRAAGLAKISDAPRLYFNDEEKKKIESLLKENRESPDLPLILVKPGTRVPAWGWSPEKFQTVTRDLLASETANVFIITGPGEEESIDAFMEGMDPRLFRLPPLAVKELALLIRHSDLLFCNHTGIMHLASATQTPVLVIFKHGNVKRWGPCHTRHVILEERNQDDLSPATVRESIDRLLQAGNIGTHSPSSRL